MLKYSLIILTIIFLGCNVGQNKQPWTVDASTGITTSKVKYPMLTTKMCTQTHLSNQFDIGINFKRYSDTTEFNDSCVLNISIQDKQTKTSLDSISMNSLFYFGNTFANCENVTSYTTKFNSNRQIVDNYFGDIVVADLNFDGKDDIAVINDNGGNGGPLYSYYIQNNNKRFKLNNFLTDSVIFFPTIINTKKFRLTTYVHAEACCMGEDAYQFDKSTMRWKHISHRLHGAK